MSPSVASFAPSTLTPFFVLRRERQCSANSPRNAVRSRSSSNARDRSINSAIRSAAHLVEEGQEVRMVLVHKGVLALGRSFHERRRFGGFRTFLALPCAFSLLLSVLVRGLRLLVVVVPLLHVPRDARDCFALELG